jgi:hypothetical protein
MRRISFVWLTVLLLPVIALAQQRSPVRSDSQKPRVNPLRGEQKLRYLVKQLDLIPKDSEFVEGLLQLYADSVREQETQQADRGDLLERVRVLYEQMQEAEKAGDKERAEQLREQMKVLGPGVVAEREFFDSLESILSEEQKAVLKRAQRRLQRVPDGTLRPIDVLRAAQSLELTPEQGPKLSKALRDFRAYLKEQGARPAEGMRALFIERIVAGIREILTPEQTERFDKQIEKLRPAAAPAAPTPVRGPEAPEPPEREAAGEEKP